MAYESNTQRLLQWADAQTFFGPNAAGHMAKFATLTKPSDEPERISI